MKILPLTSVSTCTSWLVFAQGGGGALRLVLLKVDSADLYKKTMALLEDCLWDTSLHALVEVEPTGVPLRWQVLRLLGTLWDTLMGGWGARLFLGISAGGVFQVETSCPFTCLLRPGEAGRLPATSYKEGNVQFSDKQI